MASIAAEATVAGTALVLASIAALGTLQSATNDAASDVAEAVSSLDPSYAFTGQRNCQAWTAGSVYIAPRVVVEEVEVDAEGNVIPDRTQRYTLRQPPPWAKRYQAVPGRLEDGGRERVRVIRRYRPASGGEQEPTASPVVE